MVSGLTKEDVTSTFPPDRTASLIASMTSTR
jgi:hypothetical protein